MISDRPDMETACRYLLILLFAGAITMALAVSDLNLPRAPITNSQGTTWDLAHVASFAVLAALLYATILHLPLIHAYELKLLFPTVLLCLCFGAIIEIAQAKTAVNHELSLVDLTLDVIGACLSAGAIALRYQNNTRWKDPLSEIWARITNEA